MKKTTMFRSISAHSGRMRVGAAIAVILAGAPIAAIAADPPLVVSGTNLSAPPTLRCRPQTVKRLSVCAIFLPTGEKLNPAKISADFVRWELDPEAFGPEGASSVVYVKEKSDVAGLESTVYLMTDAPGGVYRVLVTSDADAPAFSEVHFAHEMTAVEKRDAEERAHRDFLEAAALARRREAVLSNANMIATQSAQGKADAAAVVDEIEKHPCSVREGAQRYHWDTKSPIAPAAVFYDDEQHTCVQMPATAVAALPYVGDAPARFRPRDADHMLVIDGLQGSFDLRSGTLREHVEYRK